MKKIISEIEEITLLILQVAYTLHYHVEFGDDKSYLSVHVIIFFFLFTSTDEEEDDDQTEDDIDDEEFGPEEKIIHALLPLHSEVI